jgi:GH15 family glucan-1,4-alpha-glucosidase
VIAHSTLRERTPRRIDGYLPIQDYAVIGNKRTAGLVGLDGSIDWLAHPGFGDPSIFGALLDHRRGGRFALAPVAEYSASRRYLPSTNVLETTFTTADGVVRVTDAMSRPLAHTLVFNQVIRRVDGVSGEVEMAWSADPRFDYASAQGSLDRHQDAVLICHGRDVVAVQAFDAGEPQPSAGGVAGRFHVRDGECAVLALSAFHDEPLTLASRDHIVQRLDATAERWRRWTDDGAFDGPWTEAVARSALALDLLVEDETGAIAAAVTMGLPERIGGSRNFDYRYAWLRDANLTLEAMLRLGLRDQVHASLGWMFRTVRRTLPRLRPVYRLDGQPRLPNTSLELEGYRGSRPVTLGNSAQTQLQLGNFGDLFDMTVKYVEDGNALQPEARVQLGEAADFVRRVWSHRDASIWELDDQRHYTQAKLSCWLALDHAITLAERGEVAARETSKWRQTRDEIQEFLESYCWSPTLRAYRRAADGDDLDAAVLLASRSSFMEEQPERLSTTIDAIRTRLGAGRSLVYRYSGMEQEEGAFLACSFWVVEALARVGRTDEAAAAMDELIGLANDVGLYSEEIDPTSGDFLGNLPQALSHLALVNAAKAIEQAH